MIFIIVIAVLVLIALLSKTYVDEIYKSICPRQANILYSCEISLNRRDFHS